jgi:predicted RNase H-like HicB family nuclease
MLRLFRIFRRQPNIALRINVVVEADGGVYHAFAPAFKGLHVDGATPEQALQNLGKGINLYVQSLVIHGDPLPIGPDLAVHELPQIPEGAFLRSITLQWPSLQMSGIS